MITKAENFACNYGRDDDGSGLSSGVLLVSPWHRYRDIGENIWTHSRNVFQHVGAHMETDVCYDRVVVVQQDLGKSVTDFITACDPTHSDEDLNDYSEPFTFNYWKRGQIESERTFNEDGILVAENVFDHSLDLSFFSSAITYDRLFHFRWRIFCDF